MELATYASASSGRDLAVRARWATGGAGVRSKADRPAWSAHPLASAWRSVAAAVHQGPHDKSSTFLRRSSSGVPCSCPAINGLFSLHAAV